MARAIVSFFLPVQPFILGRSSRGSPVMRCALNLSTKKKKHGVLLTAVRQESLPTALCAARFSCTSPVPPAEDGLRGGCPRWPRLSEAVSVMPKNDRSHGSRQRSLTAQRWRPCHTWEKTPSHAGEWNGTRSQQQFIAAAFAKHHTWILDMNTVLRCCIYHLFHDWLDPSSVSVWSDQNSEGGPFHSVNQKIRPGSCLDGCVGKLVCHSCEACYRERDQECDSQQRERGVPPTDVCFLSSLHSQIPRRSWWLMALLSLRLDRKERGPRSRRRRQTGKGTEGKGEVNSPARSQWCPAFCFQAVRSVQLYSCQWTSRVAGDLAGTSVITQHALGWLLRHVKSRDWLPG